MPYSHRFNVVEYGTPAKAQVDTLCRFAHLNGRLISGEIFGLFGHLFTIDIRRRWSRHPALPTRGSASSARLPARALPRAVLPAHPPRMSLPRPLPAGLPDRLCIRRAPLTKLLSLFRPICLPSWFAHERHWSKIPPIYWLPYRLPKRDACEGAPWGTRPLSSAGSNRLADPTRSGGAIWGRRL